MRVGRVSLKPEAQHLLHPASAAPPRRLPLQPGSVHPPHNLVILPGKRSKAMRAQLVSTCGGALWRDPWGACIPSFCLLISGIGGSLPSLARMVGKRPWFGGRNCALEH